MALVQPNTDVAVQVNGKFRGSVRVPTKMMEAGDIGAVTALVTESPIGQKWLGDGQIVRTIFPRGKPMIGFILKQ
jgi:hypothetical protein